MATLTSPSMQNQCVILAGGLGTRMRPVTQTMPKSMLPAAGKPFVHYQLEWLAAQGVSSVVFCIGYRGNAIREFVGDGHAWGLSVAYSDEGNQLLGTAGALRLALENGLLAETFAVLYGDSFLNISLPALRARFEESAMPALMAVLRNDNQWDHSNVIYEGDSGRVVLYDKTGRDPRSGWMHYIDYGVSMFTRAVIARHVPAGEASDLAPLLHRLSLEGRLAGFEATERFYEVGSPQGMHDFEQYLQSQPQAPAVHTARREHVTGILGGGLAGLTVAAHLNTESEVLESSDRPGGHCQSVVEEGFTYDAGGPHIMFSRNQQTLDFMVSLLGGNVYKGRRNNKVYYKDRYVKYPFENGLFDLDPQDRFECLYHYIKNDHPTPKNFKEWMYHTFGTGLTEKYLLPYNEKIWNVAADQMSLDWVEGRVPRPPVEDVIKAAVGVNTEGYTHQLHFFYPERGGIEALPQGMAARVKNIQTGFEISRVQKTNDGWLVGNGNNGNDERHYEQIVSTIPLHEMANIVEGVPQEIKQCVKALRYNSLFTVTIGLASEKLPDYSAIYVPDPKVPFHRLSFPGLFSPHNVPQGQSLVQAEITANEGDGFWELDAAEVLRRVISGLEDMGLVKRSDICYSKVIRTKYGYVVQDFAYRQSLEKAKNYFAGLGISLCGRGAEFEYINMDQCIERGIKVANTLNQVNANPANPNLPGPELALAGH